MLKRRLALRRGAILLSVALVTCFLPPQHAEAQLINGNNWPRPRLMTVFPAGGKIGTTIEVICGGTEIDQPEALLFSHPGISAVLVPPPPPPPVDPKDPKAMPKPTPPGPPKFAITIGQDVPPGLHDVRIVTRLGVSNPRAFQVGELDEIIEKEKNDDVEQAQKVELDTTINGTIGSATDVDYYSFAAKKGQKVVIICIASSIDSRLNPEIKVFDSAQKQVAYSRPLPGTDAITDVTAPADGIYFVRIIQFTYPAGSQEYFYRLTFSTDPWIDAVFPPVVEPGKTSSLTLFGRNLPQGKIDPLAIVDGRILEKSMGTVSAPADPLMLSRINFSGMISPPQGLLDGFEYRLRSKTGTSNPVLLTYARDPVILENDANDTPETAQPISVPCEVAGRMDKVRDRDWFVFEAKKGDVYVIDLLCQRLGASTDLYYSLHDLANKKEITLQDDNPDMLNRTAFYTQTQDPSQYRFVVPADGKYHIMVSSHEETAADPRQVYRLRIAPERPDFRLIAMPAEDYRPDSAHINQGGVQNFMVFAQRMDGFKGQITLEMEGLPAGVTCPPQVLGGNQKSTLLCVLAADDAPAFAGIVKIKGTAAVNGQKLVREARPATITWPTPLQQNLPSVTRLDRSLAISVRDKAPGKLVAGKDRIAVSLGDKIELPTKLIRHSPEFKAGFQVTPVPAELPPGVTFAPLTYAPGKDDQQAVLTVASNAVPGTYNIVMRGFAAIASDPKAKPVNTILPSTPIQLVILPKQVATLTLGDASPVIQHGSDKELVVKVARLFDYGDSFKVQLVLPEGTKGVSAEPIVIAPGKDEAKLILKIAADAAPGPRPNLVVQAVGVVDGNVSLTHEAKFNLIVLPNQVATLSVAEPSAAIQGSDREVVLKVARLFDFKDAFKVEVLTESVKGVTATPVSIAAGQNEAKLILKIAADAVPGPRQDLVVRAVALVNGTVPLIHQTKFNLMVLPSKVGTLTVGEPNAVIQHGNDKEISVKVARLFDYKDAFKLELVPEDPKSDMKGITIAPVSIAAGQDEAKVVMKIAADAAPGPRPNLIVRAVAMVNGNVPLTHEAKFNLVVLPSKVGTLTVAEPSAVILHGSDKEINVKVARLFDYKDAFKLELLPENPKETLKGITVAPVNIAPGQNDAKLVLKVAADVPIGPPQNLIVRAIAMVNGNVPLTQDVKLTVVILPRQVANLTVSEPNVVIQHGLEKEIVVKTARLFDYKDSFLVELLPESPKDSLKGVSAGLVAIGPGQNEARLVLKVAADATPGPRPNLIVRAIAIVNGNLPLVHETKLNLLILPKQVATLSVSEPNVTVKPGSDKEIVVKLARLFDYKDAFKVQLVLPDGMKGVSAAGDLAIPAGQSEGKMILKIAPDAVPGPRDNLTIRAVAVVNGNVALTHELKFNVNVQK